MVEIGPVVLEKKSLKLRQFFFCNYVPLGKGVAFLLNKLEPPSPKGALCQVWLKLAQVLEKKILNFVNVFPLFLNDLPLEKGVALHLNKLESPYPTMLYANFG